MALQSPRRIRLARIPTPIKELERLSEYVGGPRLFIKRDDLTGIGLTGNKVRKLEFALAEALDQGADTVITTGGLGSNHARATAVAARQLGLTPHLVLRGKPGPYPDGNFLLDGLLNAEVELITREEYERRNEIMAEIAANLEKEGRKAYIIPEGASNAVGVWGYFTAAEEIAHQIATERLPHFDAVITPVGSGGTQAGLLLGFHYLKLDIPVIGINVCDDEEYFRKRISALMHDFAERYNYPYELPLEQIQLIDGYVGRGYALSRPEELEVIKLVARLEGIFLDPVYTGKAMYGLIDQMKKGRFGRDQKLLFLHTGGIFGLFPKRAAFVGGPDVGEFYEDTE